MERGATHFTHWFQPLTGSTAEKHDSFYDPTGDGNALAEFSGKELIQGEPDASSFPTGGVRATFEARGYTAWDPSSPAFILENPNGALLCIPTAFASWTGEALDHKIPLLRSMDALSRSALRALKLLGTEDASRVFTTIGPEQEYFLIDERFYFERPDLVTTGRTLFGAKPPKGHELDDHYFGSIPERVLAYMLEAEREMAKLGIPIKTRHNEVAPGQYEFAPVFENSNVGSDHQLLCMQILQNVARRYDLVCLLHEKPFAGVNGSGKHNNWSFGTDTGINLLEPGDTPHENLQFLFFCTAVLAAVDTHQELLRASIASPGQDHRLGANEAPPAIISIFLGAELQKIYDSIESGSGDAATPSSYLKLGASVLPHLPMHGGDRNRTSPFAFTGNKFEFRALGSSMSPGLPNTVLNTIAAQAIDELSDKLEAAMAGGAELAEAVLAVVKDGYAAHKRIVFNGDNYSDDWHAEAEQRGLSNLRQTPDALPALISESAIKVMGDYDVLSERELESRYEVFVEQYIAKLNIESETTFSMAKTLLLPAAIRYLGELGLAGDGAGVGAIKAEVCGLVDGFVERDRGARDGERVAPRGRRAGRGEVRAEHGRARDGRGPRDRGQARARRAGLAVAAAEVLRDPLHQVAPDPSRIRARKARAPLRRGPRSFRAEPPGHVNPRVWEDMPMPRKPVLPDKLKHRLDRKRVDASTGVAKPRPRTVPQRQGASRGPRG